MIWVLSNKAACWMVGSFLGLVGLGGCAGLSQSDVDVRDALVSGNHVRAHSVATGALETEPEDRRFLLDRQRVLWTSLAAGDHERAIDTADYVYDQLRTQGVNEGREFGRFLVGDQQVRVWKGEPFEQAAAFKAIAAVDGLMGDWGNMRAAAGSSTFQLRDLSAITEGDRLGIGEDAGGEDVEVEIEEEHRARWDAARTVAMYSEQQGEEAASGVIEGLPLIASDFAPGYALAAFAERQLGQTQEMEESLRLLLTVRPDLSSLAERIRSGSDNAVFLVDYGVGPEKIRTGPDGAIAAYRPVMASGPQPLQVRVNGSTQGSFPVLTDYNALANDLKWNNFEDVRVAKSYAGSAMVIGGSSVAALSDNTTARAIGLGVAGVGLLFKATAGADTRHCVAVPQRTYLAFASVPAGGATVELAAAGLGNGRTIVRNVRGGSPVRFYYVRLGMPELVEVDGLLRMPNQMAGAAEGQSMSFGGDSAMSVENVLHISRGMR